MSYKADLSDVKDVKTLVPHFAAGKRGSYVCRGSARVTTENTAHHIASNLSRYQLLFWIILLHTSLCCVFSDGAGGRSEIAVFVSVHV
jgi:hypothetical protein